MKTLLQRLVALVVTKPAAVLYGLNAALAPVLAFAVGSDKAWVGGVSTVIAGLAVVVTGVTAKPAAIPVVLGGATTILNASVAFGLHLAPGTTATVLAALNVLLAFGFHQALTPRPFAARLAAEHQPEHQPEHAGGTVQHVEHVARLADEDVERIATRAATLAATAIRPARQARRTM